MRPNFSTRTRAIILALSSVASAAVYSALATQAFGNNGFVDLLAYTPIGLAIAITVSLGRFVRGTVTVPVIPLCLLAIHPIIILQDLGLDTLMACGIKFVEIFVYGWAVMRLAIAGSAMATYGTPSNHKGEQ